MIELKTRIQRGACAAFALAAAWTLVPGDRARADGDAPTVSLRTVADVPMPGKAVRFDYQAVDPAAHRLYITHMNDDHLVVVDTETREVLANVAGLKNVHGVIVVPSLGKVFATATKDHDVVILDASSFAIRARLGPIGYGDGLACAPEQKKVYVSDESDAGLELVIDAENDRVVGTIELGGEAGNTVWEPTSKRILVAVQTRQEVVAIDPVRDVIAERHPIEGAQHPHGLCVDAARGRLYVADEGNASLFVIDLATWAVVAQVPTGEVPDVLALDPEPGRLYVGTERGGLHVFLAREGTLVAAGQLALPHAHTVAVDPTTHLVYVPLQELDGKPVLRILAPE
jgi:YVTN family beta-propeller protein